MKTLENLHWTPLWTTHIGCLKGCIDYLGLDISLPWLFGATGHAFIMNIHEVVCPSGPTAWKMEKFLALGKNIGYTVESISCNKREEKEFVEKQKQAWKMVKAAIDEGKPCYGWELKVPDFYVIYGYDDVGYYYIGAICDEGGGPKPWRELGATDLGWLAIFTVKPHKPTSYEKQVKDTLDFVLEFSQTSSKYLYPMYKSGPEGYDNWIKALNIGNANGFGVAYNTKVWLECREYAVKFLEEAKDKIGNNIENLFDDTIAYYRIVAENLKIVGLLFPFSGMKPEHIKDKERCYEAVKYLSDARKSEEYCLLLLKEIEKNL